MDKPIRVYHPSNYHKPLLYMVIAAILLGIFVVSMVPEASNAADQFFLWFEWIVLVIMIIYLPFALYLHFIHFNKLPSIEIWKDKVVMSNPRTGSILTLTKRDVLEVNRKKILLTFIGIKLRNLASYIKRIKVASGREDPIYATVNFLSFKFHGIECRYSDFFTHKEKEQRKINQGIAVVNLKDFGYHIFISEYDYSADEKKIFAFKKKMRNDQLFLDLQRTLT